MMAGARILVTGGAGYIGSHTAKALAAAGFEPVVLDNLSTGHDWAVKWGPLCQGDIGDGALVRRIVYQYRVEAVIHFAANAYVGESMSNPRKYFENNVVNSLHLLNTVTDCGVERIVFSSSCATYGNPARVPIEETDPQQPVNPYGESKLFVEKTLRWYGEAYRFRSVALRYFNAAGADPDGEIGESHAPETHIIPLAIHAAMGASAPVPVFGTDYETPDGTAVRDYIHVADLADAHVRALQYLAGGGASTAVNLGTGSGHSVSEVVQSVGRAAGRSVPVSLQPRRTGDPPVLVARAQKAADVLRWRPRFTELDEIVQTAWRWHAIAQQAVEQGR
jgi:UDP-glucose-4-epimerase GalE